MFFLLLPSSLASISLYNYSNGAVVVVVAVASVIDEPHSVMKILRAPS